MIEESSIKPTGLAETHTYSMITEGSRRCTVPLNMTSQELFFLMLRDMKLGNPQSFIQDLSTIVKMVQAEIPMLCKFTLNEWYFNLELSSISSNYSKIIFIALESVMADISTQIRPKSLERLSKLLWEITSQTMITCKGDKLHWIDARLALIFNRFKEVHYNKVQIRKSNLVHLRQTECAQETMRNLKIKWNSMIEHQKVHQW